MSITAYRQNKGTDARQQGMASILITMITMIVICLIVIGFAMISRREQHSTLDQQLSTQAFYAAESGVNDANKVIQNAVSQGQPVPSKPNCTGPANSPYPTGNATVLSTNVSYPCLLVDPTENTLVYNGIGQQAKMIPINVDPSLNQTISRIEFTWSPHTTQNGVPSCAAVLRSQANWSCYGILRADLVRTDGASLDRNSLASSQFTAFFNPGKSGLNSAYSAGTVNVAGTTCNMSAYTNCKADITGLPSLTQLALRVSFVYQPSDLVITAFDSSNKVVPIVGTQVTVDATGNANGVLRRIQVRLPISGSNDLTPTDALDSGSGICKRFVVGPNYFNLPGVQDPDPANAMCQ